MSAAVAGSGRPSSWGTRRFRVTRRRRSLARAGSTSPQPPYAREPTSDQNGQSRNGCPHPHGRLRSTPYVHTQQSSPTEHAPGSAPSTRDTSVLPLRPVAPMKQTRDRGTFVGASAAGRWSDMAAMLPSRANGPAEPVDEITNLGDFDTRVSRGQGRRDVWMKGDRRRMEEASGMPSLRVGVAVGVVAGLAWFAPAAVQAQVTADWQMDEKPGSTLMIDSSGHRIHANIGSDVVLHRRPRPGGATGSRAATGGSSTTSGWSRSPTTTAWTPGTGRTP